MKKTNIVLILVILSIIGSIVYFSNNRDESYSVTIPKNASSNIRLDNIPEYSDKAYVLVNNNEPFFTNEELDVSDSYEIYSDLDELGRCGVAIANISKDLMPTSERESIGSVKPSGWHTVKYDGIDGKYLYNRAHLIGYQLTAENANPKNLITGTRYLNVTGMLPFENMVADYVKETNNHVLYRVTPIFEGDNLVASGVLMEAISIEDDGEGIKFNVYCYNVQPNIEIDYATGESKLVEKESPTDSSSSKGDNSNSTTRTVILNTSSKKYHEEGCSAIKDIKDNNKEEYTGSDKELEDMGYVPCKICH